MAIKDLDKLRHCKMVLIKKGMTQRKVAGFFGISCNSVSLYINNKMTSKRLDEYFGWHKNNE